METSKSETPGALATISVVWQRFGWNHLRTLQDPSGVEECFEQQPRKPKTRKNISTIEPWSHFGGLGVVLSLHLESMQIACEHVLLVFKSLCKKRRSIYFSWFELEPWSAS